MRSTNVTISPTDHHPSRELGHPKMRRHNGFSGSGAVGGIPVQFSSPTSCMKGSVNVNQG
jgi:hypothetical protein